MTLPREPRSRRQEIATAVLAEPIDVSEEIVFTESEARRAFTMRIPESLAIEIERVVMRDKADRRSRSGHKTITEFAQRAFRHYLLHLGQKC